MHETGIVTALNRRDLERLREALAAEAEALPMVAPIAPHMKMLDYLDPSVVFEVDTYWAQTGGANVVELMNALGKRATLLHMKDGSTKREDSMTALGIGTPLL